LYTLYIYDTLNLTLLDPTPTFFCSGYFPVEAAGDVGQCRLTAGARAAHFNLSRIAGMPVIIFPRRIRRKS